MHTSSARQIYARVIRRRVSFLNIFGVLGFSPLPILFRFSLQTFLSLFNSPNAFTRAHTRRETDPRNTDETIPLQRPKSWEQRISRGVRQDETPRLLELEPDSPVGNDRRFTGRRDRARPEETLPREKKKVLPEPTAVHEVEHYRVTRKKKRRKRKRRRRRKMSSRAKR